MASFWFIQFRAFLWKVFLQRWRAPVSTLAELLLPCVFTLLLALGYWFSTTTKVPVTDYSGTQPMDMSSLLPAFFCQNMSSPRPFGRRLHVGPCGPAGPSTMCFPFVRDGALCVRDRGTFSKVMFGVYYASGPIKVPTLDAYLALSAFVSHESRRTGSTFFSRSAQASLSHYGDLLVAGKDGDTSFASGFVKYCSDVSALCAEVVHKDRVFPTLAEAEKFALKHDDRVWAIVELPTPLPGSPAAAGVEGTIFSISMNYTATPWTFESKMQFFKGLGDNDYMLYVASGFMTLQNVVQQFYARYRLDKAPPPPPSGANATGIFEFVNLQGPPLIPMPAPPYVDNSFYSRWAYFMPLVAMLAALFPVTKLVSWIVEEKSLRIREAMQIMGLRWSCMALGWFISAFLMDFVASLLAAMVFRLSFFSYVNFGVLFFLYFSFMQQNTALSLFLSSLFTNPRIAGAVGALCIFLCSMPYYSFPDGMSMLRLVTMSFVPCVAYAKAFDELAKYASFGYKFTWKNTRVGDYNVAMAIGLMWASSGIMWIFWIYLDQVLPSSIGRRRHPLFFLSWVRKLFPCCFCCCDREGSEISEKDLQNTRKFSNGLASASVGTLPPHDGKPVDEEVNSHAVVFRKLHKVYETGGIIGWLYLFLTGLRRDGDRREAVRDVSFNMDFGKINALLGPNGSGKTTLMGIATGMVTPTSGDVYICGHNAAYKLHKCREHIGYCPQSDIVWNRLTVEEHLTFYARMKVSGGWDVREQVDAIVASMQLEEKRHCIAKSLSSGQRRRLCVGIALIGKPDLLFLDEPTAGMDMRGRKAVYDALQKGRDTRAVMVSTHLLDEADRIGDKILLMHEGALCGAGSSLFLKSKMDVGYVVTCVVESCSSEMEENICISRLTEFVREKSYPGHSRNMSTELHSISTKCKLLGIERRGREISFRFPLSLLSASGSAIIRALEEEREALCLRSIGLSLTTLQDVMEYLTKRQPSTMATAPSNEPLTDKATEHGISIQIEGMGSNQGSCFGTAVGCEMNRDNSSMSLLNETRNLHDESEYYNPHRQSLARHFAVLFMKRVHCAKRDLRLVVFQILLPVVFLSLALLTDLMSPPKQPALTLDASLYPGYDTQPYSEVMWTVSSKFPDVFDVERSNMSTAFGPYYTPIRAKCDVENCSQPLSAELIPDIRTHPATRYIALALTSAQGKKGTPTSILMHNVSARHSAPQSLNALYNVVNHQLFGQGSMTTARNVPMHVGPFEQKMVSAFRRVIFGIFILLPFTFIPSNTVSFMVRERQSGSRHLQWLAGANVVAFWLSSMLFDFCCYLVTEALAMIIFVIFKRTEFIGEPKTVVASLTLFTVFGISSVPFSYVVSFFFSSPFVAQGVVLIANFVLGFLWVMGEQIIGGIKELETFVTRTTHVLRVIPSVSFGEGIFTLSGVELANMMFPERKRPNLFDKLEFVEGKFRGGIGTALIYMSCTLVVSLLLLALLEYARIQRVKWFFTRMSCSKRKNKKSSNQNADAPPSAPCICHQREANMNIDASVAREEEEVCRNETGRIEDCITLQHITKKYGGTHRPALDDLSLGVHKGEIMALLGLNGAGKTTAVGILAGEVVPTSGSAYINHLSVLRSASRSYVGYCPQKDALIDHLSPGEHLRLYAGLRGATDKYIRKEIPKLLDALGLTSQKNTPAYSLSVGNKRRLSLAVALVGGTTSVLLDEPTAGMDATARRQTCAVVRRLTRAKSVILTTHLLDETEALADRVAFISKGKLRCVGTPQELRTHYTNDSVYTVRVVFADGCGAIDATGDVMKRLRELFRTSSSTEGEECVLEGVVGRTVTLLVQQSLSQICSVASEIREGGLEGLPPVVQVSATQATLEDILLSI
ncbi:putative ABC transporter [Trypanosoma cruzi]|uniref:ABC transporter, putative n=2 Tax=Trypanosoma cruzi TaxID=5693 RepID=Q4DWA3_TRYCC|nr:ABC transporter, putative [Trypanosoma cruzi]EAN96787.1 ABC transporter, putative [Trypanosoma cruzi]PWV12933.1 putative ABC transporter [Trypanosoma cruzi]RNC44190.1 ATP-binding cassette protein subfamily A member 10 putativeABC transporter putative (ABCA10) [Trypanosoma cruzi]|eukprot:XP_818638.1 ABC transporter [Trypanosoma cruzi strain CL Brener]